MPMPIPHRELPTPAAQVDLGQDARLVLKLQAGDLNALGALYDRYRLTVYRTALAITRELDAAEDILQEAFLRLHAHIDRVDPQLPLAPWLYRITVNLSCTWVSRRNRWPVPLEGLVNKLIGPAKYHPESMVERNDQRRLIQRALDTLPFNQRVVIVLFYLNDLSLQEIADILSCPVGTVKSRLHYGREHLRRLLQDGGPTPEVQYEFT